MTQNKTYKVSELVAKLNAVRDYVNAHILEREAETDSALLTVLSDQSCLLLGDAGAAKTQHIKLLAKLIGLNLFETLMSESTKPDSIFGPPDIPALAKGIQRNKIAGYAPSAELVFFDEIFKANGVVLNNLLWLINERIFKNGDEGTIHTPIMAVFAASNEIPTDQASRPIYDRFLIRHNVNYIKSPSNIVKMFDGILSIYMGKEPEPLTKAEVEHLRRAVRLVKFPSEYQDTLIKIRDQVQQGVGVVISDRRLGKTLRVIQAHALLNGRSSVDIEDLEVLTHMLWDTPEQARKVSSIVTSNTGALSGDYLTFTETAEKVYDLALKSGDLKDGFTKLRSLLNTTKNFSTSNGIAIHRRIYELAYKMKVMLKQRKDFVINILPDERGKEWFKLSETSSMLWTEAQLRSVGFKFKRSFGYWHIPVEAKQTESKLTTRITKQLNVVPVFRRLV